MIFCYFIFNNIWTQNNSIKKSTMKINLLLSTIIVAQTSYLKSFKYLQKHTTIGDLKPISFDSFKLSFINHYSLLKLFYHSTHISTYLILSIK